jgi:hypothetical protein
VLDAAIADVCAHHGLGWDLDLALARQVCIGARDGSRPTETAWPWDDRAGKAAAELMRVLRKWAYRIKDETGAGYPPRKMAPLAGWLRPRVGWLRHHPDGAAAHGEILDAVRAARRTVDRPADRLYAGPCDCGADLYARLGAAYVVCHADAHDGPVAWPVEERRRWLLNSAADVLATATEISRALTRYQQPVTPSALRGYVHRGQLVSRGERPDGGRTVKLYRLGDVLDILARQVERVAS